MADKDDDSWFGCFLIAAIVIGFALSMGYYVWIDIGSKEALIEMNERQRQEGK